MTERYYAPLGTVLLTGAGFSKPFRGYLASEMWSLILNQPEITASQPLRAVLHDDINYERAYDAIESSDTIGDRDKQSFRVALERAYADLDHAIRSEHIRLRGQTAMMIRSFIGRFGGMGKERGFIFTLNQDLLLERYYSNENGLLQVPGIGHPDWFTARMNAHTTPPQIVMPESHKIESFRQRFWQKGMGIQNFVYLKLHGSYAWRSRDDHNLMVVGYNKAGSIAREPLLNWYLDIFREVLRQPGQRLVVVGYGFMDEHINNMIADARATGLQLYVISPMQPKDFKDMLDPIHGTGLIGAPRGQNLWDMLHGYHCSSVSELLHPDGSLTAQGEGFFRQVHLI